MMIIFVACILLRQRSDERQVVNLSFVCIEDVAHADTLY